MRRRASVIVGWRSLSQDPIPIGGRGWGFALSGTRAAGAGPEEQQGKPLRRLGPGAPTVVAIVIAVMLVGGGLVPQARAATPDRSNVVLVLDFSASILQDEANRTKFGAALERIAARVDETAADLTAGDATVSIIQFAAKAADVPNCVDL